MKNATTKSSLFAVEHFAKIVEVSLRDEAKAHFIKEILRLSLERLLGELAFLKCSNFETFSAITRTSCFLGEATDDKP
jgi:hypothetical protein